LKTLIRAGACLMLFLLAACGTLEVSIERTPTPGPDATAAIAELQVQNARLASQLATMSVPSPTTMPPPQPTPAGVLGGGTVFDGDFIFDLRLFRDASFNRHPVAASLYSDLDGIGAWMYWFYKGADPMGPVATDWGTLPSLDRLLDVSFPSIQTGSSGGRTGGVMLPGGFFMQGESKPGDRVQVALRISTPSGQYGAVLAFSLTQGLNGFEARDISVDPLRSTLAPTP
jgi:hypothetical protein